VNLSRLVLAFKILKSIIIHFTYYSVGYILALFRIKWEFIKGAIAV
jgi:hypothetical protein